LGFGIEAKGQRVTTKLSQVSASELDATVTAAPERWKNWDVIFWLIVLRSREGHSRWRIRSI